MMKWSHMFATLLLGGSLVPSVPALELYYDIANTPDRVWTIAPTYIGSASNALSATDLHVVGLSFNGDCCLESNGDFIFDNWVVKELPLDFSRYFELTLTASSDVQFSEMKYTVMGGLWSNRGGPRGVYVKVSRDGFAADQQTIRGGGWNVAQTTPYDACPNDFVDDLTELDVLHAGENLTVRFYMVYTDYGDIPGGFWNKSPDDYNLTIEFDAVTPPAPELSIYPAVELVWGSVSGLLYQAQCSSYLQSNQWQNVGGIVAGTGEEMAILVSTRAQSNQYFRVIVP